MFKTSQTLPTAAPPEALWQVLTDVQGWPAWNPGYVEARLDGALVVGSKGHLKLANGPERPFEVWESQSPTFLRYGTSDFGTVIAFEYRFEPRLGGGTSVTVEATIKGWLSPLFGRLFGGIIAGYFPQKIQGLAAAAERLASASA